MVSNESKPFQLTQSRLWMVAVSLSKLPTAYVFLVLVPPAPIGLADFVFQFMSKILDQAIADSHKLLTNPEDIQTMTRLFSSCTVHKITHLFRFRLASLPLKVSAPVYKFDIFGKGGKSLSCVFEGKRSQGGSGKAGKIHACLTFLSLEFVIFVFIGENTRDWRSGAVHIKN